MRSYGSDGVVDQIRNAGGEIYAITSEPQRLASQARAEWQLDFETIGDPHHEISNACRERGLLDLFVNTDTTLMESSPDSPFRHPKGYFQPGVLALSAEGRALYRWRSRPTRKNIGGAVERPTAKHVWRSVSDALAGSVSSGGETHAALDTNPELDSRGAPWPVFVSLLVANGWFLGPKPFAQSKDGPSAQERIKRAALRIPFFVLAWALAFFLLPGLWVGLALVGWAAWLTPKIRFLNRQFQDVGGSP